MMSSSMAGSKFEEAKDMELEEESDEIEVIDDLRITPLNITGKKQDLTGIKVSSSLISFNAISEDRRLDQEVIEVSKIKDGPIFQEMGHKEMKFPPEKPIFQQHVFWPTPQPPNKNQPLPDLITSEDRIRMEFNSQIEEKNSQLAKLNLKIQSLEAQIDEKIAENLMINEHKDCYMNLSCLIVPYLDIKHMVDEDQIQNLLYYGKILSEYVGNNDLTEKIFIEKR